MSLTSRRDPVLAFNFLVSLYDATARGGAALTTIALTPLFPAVTAGFSECTGLEMSLELDDWMEGGRNGGVLKFPKRTRHAELVLRHGVTRSSELFDWFQGFTLGSGKRKDGLITLCDAQHRPHTVWGFRRGLPSKYSGPQLNAQQSTVAVEAVTITHEGLYQLGGAAALAGAIGEAAGAIRSLF